MGLLVHGQHVPSGVVLEQELRACMIHTRQREDSILGMAFTPETLKPAPSDTSPNPSQTVLPSGTRHSNVQAQGVVLTQTTTLSNF